MKDIEYSFEERRRIDLVADDGSVGYDSFDVTITISHLSFEQKNEVRQMIERYCRGTE